MGRSDGEKARKTLRYGFLLGLSFALMAVSACGSSDAGAGKGAESEASESPNWIYSCSNIDDGWQDGSCVGTALTLTESGGSDPLEALSGHCTAGDSFSFCESDKGKLGDEWDYSSHGLWYLCDPWYPCERYENVKFETRENDGRFEGSVYHVFSAREEEGRTGIEGTTGHHYQLPDDNARPIERDYPGTLFSPGKSYKFSLDVDCRMTDESSGVDRGGCTEAGVGNFTTSGGLFVSIGCNTDDKDYWDWETTIAIMRATIPPYGTMSRFEREFAVRPGLKCQHVILQMSAYNDDDAFEKRKVGTENGATTTTPDYRTYRIDNMSIAPLAIGTVDAAPETEKGLSDYFKILKRCDGVCGGKVFSDDMYDTENSVYLVGGFSPYLVRNQGGVIGKSYEIKHQPTINAESEKTKDQAYFFISPRPDEVAPWTIPMPSMEALADTGIAVDQETGAGFVSGTGGEDDTIEEWIAVRNPTSAAISPLFELPWVADSGSGFNRQWRLYAVVQLPILIDSDYDHKVSTFEIVPDHLVECRQVSVDKANLRQQVKCQEPDSGVSDKNSWQAWTIPPESSRSYVLEIPHLGLSRAGAMLSSVVKMVSGGSDELPVSVTGITPSPSETARIATWGAGAAAIGDTMAYFEDLKKLHVTDAIFTEDNQFPATYTESDKDINGNGVIDSFYYFPMKKVTEGSGTYCMPQAGNMVKYLEYQSAYKTVEPAAETYNIDLGLDMNAFNGWSWSFSREDTNGDGWIWGTDTIKAYPVEKIYQSGVGIDPATGQAKDYLDVDLDHNGKSDWNVVELSDDKATSISGSGENGIVDFNPGDLITWKTKWDAGAPLAQVVKVEVETHRLYLDIPFPDNPSGTNIYRLYHAGNLNQGIALATRSDLGVDESNGIGVCAGIKGSDGKSLEAINVIKLRSVLPWDCEKTPVDVDNDGVDDGTGACEEDATTKRVIVESECELGSDPNAADYNTCKLDPDPSVLQGEIFEALADDYLNAIGSTGILQFAGNYYDEIWSFAGWRTKYFFEGVGQMELMGLANLFENKGLRTTNSNWGSYFVLENEYVSEDPENRRGMSFPATTGVEPLTTPFMADLLEGYRDKGLSDNQPIIYSGGYAYTMPPFDQRYKFGLGRLKSGEESGTTPGALLWAYVWALNGARGNDPDYLEPDDVRCYVSTTAQYVAYRDHLGWGSGGHPYRAGLRQPVLGSKPCSMDFKFDSSWERVTAWSGFIEGYHDLRMAQTKATALDNIPWGVVRDGRYSTCVIATTLNPDLSYSCGDYRETGE